MSNSPKEKIDEQLILKIITSFYELATNDVLIGYHFRNIQDFDQHLPHIAAFWSIQLNSATTLPHASFDLMKAHQPLGIKPGELDRWVKLFKGNLDKFELDDDQKNEWLNKVDFFKEKLARLLLSSF